MLIFFFITPKLESSSFFATRLLPLHLCFFCGRCRQCSFHHKHHPPKIHRLEYLSIQHFSTVLVVLASLSQEAYHPNMFRNVQDVTGSSPAFILSRSFRCDWFQFLPIPRYLETPWQFPTANPISLVCCRWCVRSHNVTKRDAEVLKLTYIYRNDPCGCLNGMHHSFFMVTL